MLTDPDTLKRTLPDCQKFDKQDDGSYSVTMNIGIAAIKGTYSGKVQMLNEKPPESYTLKMSARGGVGFVDGEGHFILAPEGSNATLLRYTGKANVGGKIAGVGQRVLHAGANMVIGQFFKALDKEVQSAEKGQGSGVAS